MENLINWLAFFNMLPFMLFGLLVHIFGKFLLAQKKPDYSFLEFVQKNQWGWVMSLLYCVIGCYLFVRGIGQYNSALPDVVALILGISGGSLGKTTIKILTSKKEP